MRTSKSFKIIGATLLLYTFKIVGADRAGLYFQGQPNSMEIHRIFNWFGVDRSQHYLNSANLSSKTNADCCSVDTEKDLDSYQDGLDRFKGNNFLLKVHSIRWYFDVFNLAAIHVYDDPEDMKRAAGPQVDQSLCGLHLDYMLHMVDKYQKHITDSDDWSIFNMINSFGSINGVASGLTLYLGDYESCKNFKLSINREELARVDKLRADQYFDQYSKQRTSENHLNVFWKYIKTFIGPFFGFIETIYDSEKPLENHRDKIKLQSTVYCMAGIRWPTWDHLGWNTTFHKRNVIFRVGVCLPDTCDSSSLDLYHDKIKRLMDIQMPDYHKGYYINDLYCLPDEESPLRNPFDYPKSALFIVFNIVWILLTIIATTVVFFRKISPKTDGATELFYEYLRCWCFISNFQKFISGSSEKKLEISSQKKDDEKERVNLDSLDGIKVIGFVAIVTVHSLITMPALALNPIPYWYGMNSSPLVSMACLFQTSVDLFFVVTGIVVSLKLLQNSSETLMKPIFWIQFFVYRYLRIVPIYLFVHLGIQSYTKYLYSGPLWDYGTSNSGIVKQCQMESVWEVVFPQANFKSPINHCNPVGWYLANDIQFSLITPLIIILFVKKPMLGHLVVLSTSLFAMINHVSYYLNLLTGTNGYLEFSLQLAYILHDGTLGYVMPQYRFLSYFIGLSAGQLLFQYGRGEIQKWPSWFVSYGKAFMLSALYIVCSIYYLRHLLPRENQSLIHSLGAIFAGSLHFFASVTQAILIILLCTGHLEPLRRFLSGKLFRLISAASLSCVLVHVPVLMLKLLSSYNLHNLTIYNTITTSATAILESIFFGVLVFIAYELPMRRFLIKCLIIILGGRKPQEPHHNESLKTLAKKKAA